MLGASPGASTAVAIITSVIQRCFAPQLANGWAPKLKTMIPSFGSSLIQDPTLAHRLRASTAEVLNLQNVQL